MKIAKMFLSLVLTALLAISAGLPAMAEEGGISVILNGRELSFDVPPQSLNGRTMVPLRAIFEALDASVDWIQSTQTVISRKNDVEVRLTVGESVMYVNGKSCALDAPAYIVDGRVLVPVRAVAEAYQANVSWDGDTRTVYITYTNGSYSRAEASKDIYEAMKSVIIYGGQPEADGSYTMSFNSSEAPEAFDGTDASVDMRCDPNTSTFSLACNCSQIGFFDLTVTVYIYGNGRPAELNYSMGMSAFAGMDLDMAFRATEDREMEMIGNSLIPGMEAGVVEIINPVLEIIDRSLELYGTQVRLANAGVYL